MKPYRNRKRVYECCDRCGPDTPEPRRVGKKRMRRAWRAEAEREVVEHGQ